MTWKAVQQTCCFQSIFPDILIPCLFSVHSHDIAYSFILTLLMACTLAVIAGLSRAVVLYSAAMSLIWFKVALSSPLASCSCHLVSSLCSFWVIQWLCSCASTAGREVCKNISLLFKLPPKKCILLWGNTLVKAVRVVVYLWHFIWKEKKRLCWNEGFGFELLYACVWVFLSCLMLMVYWEEGCQDSEIQNLLVMLGYVKCHCLKRSVLPLPWRLLSWCQRERGPSGLCLQNINLHFPLLLLCWQTGIWESD